MAFLPHFWLIFFPLCLKSSRHWAELKPGCPFVFPKCHRQPVLSAATKHLGTAQLLEIHLSLSPFCLFYHSSGTMVRNEPIQESCELHFRGWWGPEDLEMEKNLRKSSEKSPAQMKCILMPCASPELTFSEQITYLCSTAINLHLIPWFLGWRLNWRNLLYLQRSTLKQQRICD